MSSRRELGSAIGLCLLGSALVLLAVARSWVSVRIGAAAPLPSRGLTRTGIQLAPGTRPLALVGLAAVAAIPASRGLVRVLVGLVTVVSGASGVAIVGRALSDRTAALTRSGPLTDAHFGEPPSFGAWPYVALLGGVLITAAGLLVVVRGRSWAAMSSRYDAPAQHAPVAEAGLWDSLDRGEDPTTEGSDGDG